MKYSLRLVLLIIVSARAAVSASEFSLSTTQVLFEGAFDGSAGSDVGGGFFVGATDEDNKLRLYDVKGGPPRKTIDLGVDAAIKSALGLKKVKECDFEGAAKMGDLIFWIGSHGRDKDANEKKERQILLATKLTGVGKHAKLQITGSVYTKLIQDFLKNPALASFHLAKAATLAPNDEGGLNIESLAADHDKLWIGFRNPKSGGKDALLVPLLNPKKMISRGTRAKLGDPLLLNLNGLGVRDMVAWNDGFLIIAGDFVDRFEADAKPSRAFWWKPGTKPKDVGVDFGDLNPEAIMIVRDGNKARILILSDDGKYPGRNGAKTFRGVWLQQNSASAAGANTSRVRWNATSGRVGKYISRKVERDLRARWQTHTRPEAEYLRLRRT
ncbi:MAG TPA: DUF3616 domain-containing protein [Candidatus Udaeobacter sp.]